jgi:hypothetical protein
MASTYPGHISSGWQCALLVGIAIWGALAAYRLCWGLRARSWPTVPGIVELSRVAPRGGGRGSMWAPVLRYRYEAKGVWHRSSRIAFYMPNRTRRSAAARIAAAYPQGSTARVFHDPRKPSRSVLRTGAGTMDAIFALAGAAALATLALRMLVDPL